jgi:4'-phosphopantetheinyl transferase
MPIVHQQQPNQGSTLAIWKITETESWFLEKLDLSPTEWTELEQIKGERRREWLAARQLVWELSGHHARPALFKDQYGKPHLQGLPLHFSLSHSHQLAAAIISDQITGIDIQVLVAKIERIVPKFLSAAEQGFISEADRLPHLHVCWGAKEAMYKAYGQRELDLIRHIQIQPFEYREQGGVFQACIVKDHFERNFEVHFERFEEAILVAALS